MSQTEISASLKAAEGAIANGEYKAALQHCKAALKADRKSSKALLLIGKAAFHLKEYEQAELAYRRALEAKPGLVQAWEGLAEVFAASNNTTGEIEACERLLQLSPEDDPRDHAIRVHLAEAYFRAGAVDNAIHQYIKVLSNEPPSSAERVPLLAKLADVLLRRDEAAVAGEVQEKVHTMMDSANRPDEQCAVGPHGTMSCLEVDILAARVAQDSEAGGQASLFAVLSELSELAPPSLKYLPYREEYVRRCLLRIFSAPCRSTERQQFRLAALRECVSVLCHGGSCSPLPYEAAVWLLEEEEEIKGGQVSVGGQEVGGAQALAGGVQAGAEGHIGAGRCCTVALAAENFSRRLIHQFPFHPTARMLLALMLRRHAVSSGKPVSQKQRRQLECLLESAMVDDSLVDCASGYKALSELQYENRNYDKAIDTATRGLRWLQQRRERGHESLTHVALGLRLVLAKSLRRLERLDEAERHFKSLAGWVTEGEAAFSEMCGSAPTSIHQQALRGIALVSLARGDFPAARAQYERILGKAALGRGPAEHWAHADYGWLLFQDGDTQGARFHLEKALHVADEEGCAATDSQVGEHRYRLGEVYWKLKGRYRSDKRFAYSQFFEAAKVEGHAQASALAALGRYFQEVENRPDAAQKCFKKALAIDPSVDIAGDGLCSYLVSADRKDAAIKLCREVATRAPQTAIWAWKRLGMLLIEEKQPAEAIAALQAGLRAAPGDASAWEALGAAYQPLGRLTAALKAYSRAIELDPSRIYSLIQSGNLYLTLGNPLKALQSHEGALALDPDHPAALLGGAEALAAIAGAYIHTGALKAASKELQRAAELAGRCAAKNSCLIAAWKQLGDVLLLARNAPENTLNADEGGGTGAAAVEAWQGRIRAVQHSRRAYIKALHLEPSAASAWQDVACTFYHESQLYRAHTAGPENLSFPLQTRAVLCLRGALRLDPSSPELWAALGVASTDRATKEYALSRSLQLDPRSSTAWVALARLYIDEGEPALAERCLQQGRSQDPAVGLIWEAMAALAALSSSPGAEKDTADFNEHAVGLGAGPEGLLGYAEAALHQGKFSNGGVYTAAYRAAELDPLNPAALNVWGLACESKGDAVSAVRAYRAALDLLPGAVNASRGIGNGEMKLLQMHPPTTKAGIPLYLALKLNLARALVGARLYNEAVGIYGDLEFEGAIDNQPHALLSYAIVRAETGDLQGAEYCGELALEAAHNDGHVGAAAVEVLMLVKALSSKPEELLGVLQRHLQRLDDLKAPADDVKRLWKCAMAAAAVLADGSATAASDLARKTMDAAKAWAASSDQEDAAFIGDLLALQGTQSLIGDMIISKATMVSLAKAVHTCPSSTELRLSLAATACDATPGYASSVLRLLRSVAVNSTDAPEMLRARLEAATAAVLDAGITVGAQRAREEARLAARAIHARPTELDHWYMGALLAGQVAAVEQTPRAHKRALSLSSCALALEERHLEDNHQNMDTSTDVDLSARSARAPSGLVQSRLLVCISESQLRLYPRDTEKKALTSALAAVDRAPGCSNSSSSSSAYVDALRQVARCHWAQGEVSQAQAFFTRAMESTNTAIPSGALAAMELAACLESWGRGRDAVEVLHEEASRLNGIISNSQPAATGGTASNTREFLPVRVRQQTGLVQQVLLQRTLVLARLGDLEAAKLAAQEATPAQEGPQRGLGLVAQGAVCLQQALAVGLSTDAGVGLLGEARRALTEALQKGQDGVVPRALLAELEYSGTMRNKAQRVAAHSAEAVRFAARPVPGELLELIGRLQGSQAWSAKAVHSAPWQTGWWAQLLH